jgi:putative ABC transport system permease protein
MRAFDKDIQRSVLHSLGRFLAIVGIVALGCGFYAGLRMTGPDMRLNADAFYDGTHLYDIRVLSSSGFSDDMVSTLQSVEGVESVMPAYSADVMASVNNEQYVIRMGSMDVQAAQDSTCTDDIHVDSDDDQFLNRPILEEGSWPTGPGECVLSADRASKDPIHVGDTITIDYGTSDLDQVLDQRSYTVTGLVHSSSYVSDSSLGSTTLGSGKIQQYMYVSPDNFSSDYPLTECFIRVQGADALNASSDAYRSDVNATSERISDLSDTLSQQRVESLKSSAQSDLDTQRADFEAQQEQMMSQLGISQAQLAALSSGDATQTTANNAAQGQATANDSAQLQAASTDATQAQTASTGTTQMQAATIASLNEQLAQANAQFDSAQQQIDAISAPDIYVLDRSKNFGVKSFDSDATRVDNIAAVFPLIFFLVAALVSLTTMTRMVDEDRILIGTYKALGYGRVRIASKYVIYAALASVSGAAIGILVLSQVLPAVICSAYAIIYNVPQHPFPLTVDVPLALISAGMGIGITLIATIASVTMTVREDPAALMLPRAPKPGKRILLERISPVWHRLSFSWKVTFRNLFRYKKRFLMTVIGIAGCTALLLTGLGLSNAINDIIDRQYGVLQQYNLTVTVGQNVDADAIDRVASTLDDSDDISQQVQIRTENRFVSSEGHDDESTELIAPQDYDRYSQLVLMRDRTTHDPVAFDSHSVVLTEKLATSLGVQCGDTITVRDQDTVGNATGDGYVLTVTGIMENYVGNYLIIGSDAYTQAFGSTPDPTAIEAQCTTDPDARTALNDTLRADPSVGTVLFIDEVISSYRQMLQSVDMIVVVLVVAAAALAFIVLYNMTNINITERTREIASLKVLGFLPREVDLYVFREIVLLTCIGSLLGLVLGVYMEGFVVVTAEVDQVMFGRDIHPMSFVIAFVLTMAFALCVMLVMRRKLNRIGMVESLKSVD